MIAFVRSQQLQVAWILETHAHADHLSAAHYLKAQLGGQIAIGEHITQIQSVFQGIFNLGADFKVDGSQFDRLLQSDEVLPMGALSCKVLFVPGHTPACVAFQIGDAVFVGDTLFMPGVGTARCDFPGGNAQALYVSVQKILSLPGDTRLFMCHDYPPDNARPVAFETTVRAQREHNVHVHEGISEAQFVAMRTQRDATLEMPALILPSIQLNMRAGEMPPLESNGVRYFKIPINAL